MNQTWKNIEILIGDNASSDNTEEVVSSMLSSDARIKYYKNTDNLGYSKSCNQLIHKARGEFVCIYHSDDIYDQTIIEKQIKFLTKHKNLLGCFTDCFAIDTKGKHLKHRKSHNYSGEEVILNRNDFISSLLDYRYNPICCPSSMIRKEAYLLTGGYSEDIKEIFDQDMWLKLLDVGDLGIINEKLVKYRIHNKQLSFIYRNPDEIEIHPMVLQIESYLKNNKSDYDELYIDKVKRLYASDYIIKAKLSVLIRGYAQYSALLEKSKEFYIFTKDDKLSLFYITQRLPRVFSYIMSSCLALRRMVKI